MMALDDLETLTVEEVAEILGVRPETVRIWIREGALRAMKWGRRFHVRPEAVEQFQEGRAFAAPDPLRAARHRAMRGRGSIHPVRP